MGIGADIGKTVSGSVERPRFFYLQEAEGTYIFRNALSLYTINESLLLRYASRRGVRENRNYYIN